MRRHVDVVGHGMRFYGGLVMVIMALLSLLMVALAVALAEPIVLAMVPLYLVFGALFGLPFWFTGRGLLEGRAWARNLGIVLSVFLLSDFPIGMSLGMLGLGVLLDDEVRADFEAGRPAQRTVGVDRAAARLQARHARVGAMERGRLS